MPDARDEWTDSYLFDRGCLDCGALPGEDCSDWCVDEGAKEQELLAPGGVLRDPWPEHHRHRTPDYTCTLCRLLEEGYP